MDLALLYTIAGFTICILSYAIYIHAIYKHGVKPHLFSWTLFSILGSIGFCAQYSAGAGIGMWITAIGTAGNILTAIIALQRGEKHFTRSDWFFFVAALAAIPVFLMTDTALYAVIMICAIDAMAMFPTFRKSWMKPWDENATAYGLVALQFAFSVMAMDNINIITALYPLTIVCLNILLMVELGYRRQALAKVS